MLGTRQEGAEAGDRCCPPLSSRLWCGRQASLLPPSPPPHTHGGPQPLGCCPVLRQLPLHGPEGPSPSSGASGTAPPHPLPLAQTVTEGADPGQPPRALSTPSSQPEWRGTVALGCRGGGPWRGVAAGAGAEAGCRWAPPDSLRVVHATSEAERNKPARWAAAWRQGAVSTRLVSVTSQDAHRGSPRRNRTQCWGRGLTEAGGGGAGGAVPYLDWGAGPAAICKWRVN